MRGKMRKIVSWLSIAAALATTVVALGACSAATERLIATKSKPKYSPRVTQLGMPVPKGGGRRKLGSPYTIKGITYVPRHDPTYDRVGIASWYGEDFHGRLTANGEVYDMHDLSAAHPTLPLPSFVRVTNMSNGRSVVVRVNDRGPFARGRIIDLSNRAARELGFARRGTAQVRVTYLREAPL